MSCAICDDKGLTVANWADPDRDCLLALCLCPVGLTLRRDVNCGKSVAPLWRVWCAREQVEPATVVRLEHVLTPAELEERGLRVPSPGGKDLAAIVAAARGKGKGL